MCGPPPPTFRLNLPSLSLLPTPCHCLCIPDFTGYWALAKHEGMDEFLKAAGFPWVVRKAASKFGGSAVDLIAHSGPVMRVTSLNAKGSWSRMYDTEREVTQRNAEGTMCRTTSWWEGECTRGPAQGWMGWAGCWGKKLDCWLLLLDQLALTLHSRVFSAPTNNNTAGGCCWRLLLVAAAGG